MAPLLSSAAHSQEPDWSSLDYDRVFDEVLAELETVGSQNLENIIDAKYIASDRSILDIKKMAADFPVPPLTEARIAEIRARKYGNIAADKRPHPEWPAATKAPDYAHLSVLPLSSTSFTLSADVLRALAERNAFDLTKTTRPVVLFGLRGCRIADASRSGGWAKEHALAVATPSHVSSSCVIGVWRRSDDHISVYRGSTVPAVAHMYMSLAERGVGASLLPTGLYRYGAGAHLASKPASIQRGALRIADRYVVLRTAKELVYDPYAETTAWTRGEAHNIHAGGAASPFSCAGCQVIPGSYSGIGRRTSNGQWASFQRDAGLIDDKGVFVATDTSPSYLYMLLTGSEAALTHHGGKAFDNGYVRLRPGSTGEDVKALQSRLIKSHPGAVPGLTADGRFGMFTSFAVLIDEKTKSGEYASLVVSI